MKAKIKHTQQIIDVEWDIRGWIWEGPKGKRIFDAEELVFFDNDNVDWQSFRAEAAKDILCAVINRESPFKRNGEVVVSHKDFIEIAVEDADALIKQLKEKEEN